MLVNLVLALIMSALIIYCIFMITVGTATDKIVEDESVEKDDVLVDLVDLRNQAESINHKLRVLGYDILVSENSDEVEYHLHNSFM